MAAYDCTCEPAKELPRNSLKDNVSEVNGLLFELNDILGNVIQTITGGDPSPKEEKRSIECFFDEVVEMKERGRQALEKAAMLRHLLFG